MMEIATEAAQLIEKEYIYAILFAVYSNIQEPQENPRCIGILAQKEFLLL